MFLWYYLIKRHFIDFDVFWIWTLLGRIQFLCQTILCQVFNKLTWDYLQTITVWILGNFSQNLLLISENSLTITLQLVQNSFEILFIDGVDPLDCCFLQWVLSVRLQWLCWSRLRLYTAYSYSALLQQLQYSVSTLRPNCAASSTLHCLPCSWVRAESFCLACTGLAFPFLSSMFLLLWLACCWEHSDYNQQWIPRKKILVQFVTSNYKFRIYESCIHYRELFYSNINVVASIFDK